MSDASYGYNTQGGHSSPSNYITPGEQGSPDDITPHSQNTSLGYQPDKYRHQCPYPDCDRKFACPHNVAQHCREKHGEGGRSDCTVCEASFARGWGMYRHMDTVHGINIHPGRGKRRRSRKAIGRQGPKLVYPQPTQTWKIKILSDVPVLSDSEADVGAVQTFDSPAFFDDPGAEFLDETTFEPTMDDEITDGNFTYQQITCALCLETFEIREDFLGHNHIAHGFAYSGLCDCLVCTAQKLSGVPFEEVQMTQKTHESTNAQPGTPEIYGQSLLVDTAMNMDENSTFQDSPVPPLSIGQLPEGDLATTVEVERSEDGALPDFFDFDGASAGYDQFDFQHLDEGW